MGLITKILSNSILKGNVNIGDEVVAFGDRPFEDILDYIFADSSMNGSVRIVCNGKVTEIPFAKKLESDTLGLEFDESVEIKPKECCNNCIFCFVRQMPYGLRDTLYIRDDDYRLSFISGSYITGTNLREKDIQRIIDYKLSPLYVSVHATDEEVRKFLLGIKKAPCILEQIKRLVSAGITIHAQIVLVGGINDGDCLKKSLSELYGSGVSTVAVVPVGLTCYREGRYRIEPLTKEQAESAIDIVEEFYVNHVGFSYCSDEMYQIAKRPVRDSEYYGEYEQIENGVGLVSKFLNELDNALDFVKGNQKSRKVGVITGVSGESTMLLAKEAVRKKFPNIEINVYVVKNDFFGRTVTVTGLVTATDIIKQYGSKKFDEEYLMIPSVMMKEFEDVFLDGITLKNLSKTLKKQIVVAKSTGYDYLDVLLNGRSKLR